MIATSARLSLLLACLSSPCVLHAQDRFPGEGNFGEDPMLWGEEETIYTATKFNKRLDQAPAIATVITAKQIKNMGARNILEVLDRVPGLSESQTYGFLRGVEVRGIKTVMTEKILFMLDGQRLQDINIGNPTIFYRYLSLDQVARIEVIRGPGSALHGADAFLGIVNVITKDTNQISSLESRFSSGSFNTHDMSQYAKVAVGDKGQLSIFARSFSTQGADTEIPFGGTIPFSPIIVSGNTDHGVKAKELGLKFAHTHWTLQLHHINRQRESDYGITGMLSENEVHDGNSTLISVDYRKALNESTTFHSHAYYKYQELDPTYELVSPPNFPGPGAIGRPKGKGSNLAWENQLDLSHWENHTLTLGLSVLQHKQYEIIHLANFNPNTGAPLDPIDGTIEDISDRWNFSVPFTRNNYAAYLQDQWQLSPQLEATVGLRYDHYSDVGNATSPRLALVWNNEKLTLRALYGEAFRAPTFAEKYQMNNPSSTGNPDLLPEEVKTLELNASYHPTSAINASVTYFNMQLQELINLDLGVWQNQGEASSQGLESEFKWSWDKQRSYAYINHTYQNAVNESTGKDLPLVAKQKANIGINYLFAQHWNLNTNLKFSGKKQREDNDDRPALAGYNKLDITLTRRDVVKNLDLQLAIYNATDKTYADPSPLDLFGNPIITSDFIAPERSMMLKLEYRAE